MTLSSSTLPDTTPADPERHLFDYQNRREGRPRHQRVTPDRSGLRFQPHRKKRTGHRPTTGEWILLGPAAANRALIDDLDRSGPVSVIDHTHSRALFRLTGAASASALEKLCNLDWSDHMTPDGAAVSASVAEVTCDIVRNDLAGARSYLVACDRSFGQYLFDAILDAGQEFGISPLVDPVA